MSHAWQHESILNKLKALPPQLIQEVEDFIDFLKQKEQDKSISYASMKNSEKVFGEIWDNSEDADYDKL